MFEEAGAMFPLAGLRVYGAISPLDRGQWDRAAQMIDWSLSFPNELAPLARAVAAVIALRRGEPGARTVLERAGTEMASLPECSRHGFVRAALAEAAWLTDDPGLVQAQVHSARESPRTAHLPGRTATSRCGLGAWGSNSNHRRTPPRRCDWSSAATGAARSKRGGRSRRRTRPRSPHCRVMTVRRARLSLRCTVSAPRARCAPSPASGRRSGHGLREARAARPWPTAPG